MDRDRGWGARCMLLGVDRDQRLFWVTAGQKSAAPITAQPPEPISARTAHVVLRPEGHAEGQQR